jgi:DeoR family fructose operon transcriptional repressor
MSGLKVVFAEERKDQILRMLSEKDKVHVQQLSDMFQVSSATIRNDLNDLEKGGKLVRTHGGAISAETSGEELRTEQKKTKNMTNKAKIAEIALDFIADGDIILLDTGTTTEEIAKLLHLRRNVTVITNDMEIAMILEEYSGITVIIIGGMLRQGFHCTVGMFAHHLLDEVTVDKAFIATNSLDVETGLFTPDTGQAETKMRMMSCGRETYLVCDSSKVGRKSFAKFADLEEFKCFITDSELDEETVRRMKEKVDVILA